MRYFTSDFHFGHEKDFLWAPRGFISYEDHAKAVIKNYNEIIRPNDEVFILGDCMLTNDDFGMKCLRQLNGIKYLAIGNHDSARRIARYRQEKIFDDIQYGYRFDFGKITFYAQHYPAMMGNYKDKHPTICLAGHTHSPDKFQNMNNGCYNVALDAHNCYPVSIEQIITDIKGYRKNHPIEEYPNRSPYCDYCKNKNTCIAKTGHELPCPGYIKE